MPRRTISLAKDAYERLRKAKKPNESFSDVVRRLTRRRSLLELCDVMPKASAERLAKAVEANRRQRRRRRDVVLS